MCRSNMSMVLSNKHISLSHSDDSIIILWGGEKKKLTAADIKIGREKADRERVMQRKTEKGKQFFCVSHQVSVVQFLLLSSTGNNYQEGRPPGQLALFHFYTHPNVWRYFSLRNSIYCSLINGWKRQPLIRIALWGLNNSVREGFISIRGLQTDFTDVFSYDSFSLTELLFFV